MKTYKIEISRTPKMSMLLFIDQQIEEEKYWHYIGCFDADRASLYLLLSITGNNDIAFKYADRFNIQFFNMKERYPMIIDSRKVLDWVSEQNVASL